MPITRATIGLGVLLVAAAAVRLWALELEGHNGDVRVTAGWAVRMADVGPWRFYDGSGSIYPALLYPLWALGAMLDGEALLLAVKGMSIPFDLAIGALLYIAMRAVAGPGAGLVAAALFLLNPAAVLAGPVWGQVDSAGTLPYLGALLALGGGRYGWAGALAALATLVKPQFGLVVLPVLVVAVLAARTTRSWTPILRTAGGMAVASILVAAPLALHPLRYLGLLTDTATRQPATSLNAFNPWGLLVGFDVPDGPYVGLGTLLLVMGCIGSLLVLRRGTGLAPVLAAGALLALAFYFLPTRVHERYLFPAVALLVPFAVAGGRSLWAYVVLSLSFAAALVYALLDTTPFSLPEPWAGRLLSDAAVWIVGAALIGSAVAWAWLLGVRDPRLPRRMPERRPDPGPAP